jgi:hypothetical protein
LRVGHIIMMRAPARFGKRNCSPAQQGRQAASF